jgi:hypothetical protein
MPGVNRGKPKLPLEFLGWRRSGERVHADAVASGNRLRR